MTTKPKYHYGQVLFVNDDFFRNVKVKCWGLAYMADPDYPKNQMCVYDCENIALPEQIVKDDLFLASN